MKKLYWQPQRVSRTKLTLIALFSVVGYLAVEYFLIEQRQPYFTEKVRAARLSETAMQAIKDERLRRKIAIDREVDPAESGLIGEVFTSVTSGSGSLTSKQTSANPNYAALIVHWLTRLELEPGDTIAVGVSGSFPAINISVYAALATLKLKPIIISSAAASQFGANHPEFSWLDMEAYLFRRGIFPFRSVAASRGGVGDRGLGMPKAGRFALDGIIDRNGVPQLQSRDDIEAVEHRLRLYADQAGEAPIKAYVNVGGGTISVGTKVGKKEFEPGITRRPPVLAEELTSVMGEFVKQGVPVVHLVKIATLAEQFGFEVAPTKTPAVGAGKVFMRRQYNRWLAAVVLVAIMAVAFFFIRMSFGLRLGGRSSSA